MEELYPVTVGSVDATPAARPRRNERHPLMMPTSWSASSGWSTPRARCVLTDDGQAVDGRYAGFTMSAHEECAVELAVQIAAADRRHGDRADARRRRRGRAAARGAGRRLHRGDPRRSPTRRRSGRPTWPARSPPWCATTTADARPGAARQRRGRQRRLPGRHPARLRARAAGGQRRHDGRRSPTACVTASGDGPDGHETYQVPLPAVVTVLEGGVEPRYPTVPGRMKAKKVAIEERAAGRRARRPGAGPAAAAAARAEQRADPRQGRGRRARRGRPARAAGGAGPMILVLVETDLDGRGRRGVPRGADLRPLAVARPAAACPIDAVVVGDAVAATLRRAARGVRRPRRAHARPARRSRRTPARPGRRHPGRARGDRRRWSSWRPARRAATRCWPTSPPALGVAMAANVLSFGGLVAVHGDPSGRRRRGAGGDAAGRPAGGLHRRRPRGRGRARRDARGRPTWSSTRPRWPRPTWSPGWCRREEPEPDLSGAPEVGARSWSAPAAAPAAPTGSPTCSS